MSINGNNLITTAKKVRVLNNNNPSNVPQTRPIQNVWALLARAEFIPKDEKQKMMLNFAVESKGSSRKS
jgi:hypothetical protein